MGELGPLVSHRLLCLRLAGVHVSTVGKAVGISVQLGQTVGLGCLTRGFLGQNAIVVRLEVGAGIKINQDRATGADLFDHVFF